MMEVFFGAGEMRKMVQVGIQNDSVLEAVEMFSASIISGEPNVIVNDTRSYANVTILDDDSEFLQFNFFSTSKFFFYFSQFLL